MDRYYTAEALYFSAVSGGGVYQQTGETAERLRDSSLWDGGSGNRGSSHSGTGVGAGTGSGSGAGTGYGSSAETGYGPFPGSAAFPYAGDRAAGGKSPVLTNLTTGEQVYLRRVNLDSPRLAAAFRRRVLDPPMPDDVFWPVDLLTLPKDIPTVCGLSVDRAYCPEGAARGPDSPGVYAAAFPLADFSGLRDGRRVLAELSARDGLHWKEPAACALALRLTEAMDRLDRDGCLYHDLHPSRFFLRPDGRVIFDYSNLACPSGEGAVFYSRERAVYPVEFADPAAVRGIVPRPDRQSRNYSLCALLFYVLFGRFPCDGPLLAGSPDDSPANHYVKFRDYHRMPIFLFDPEDKRNAPGLFAEDDALTDLWESAPEDLRRLFTDGLSTAAAERRRPSRSPGPAEVLDVFRRLGWNRTAEEKTAKKSDIDEPSGRTESA